MNKELVKLISISPNNEFVMLQNGDDVEGRWIEKKEDFDNEYELIHSDQYKIKDCN